MVEHKFVSFAAIVALPEDSWNFTSKANSHIPQVEIHARQKLCHFRRYVAKTKLFCPRNFRSGSQDWSVHTGKFSSRFPRDLRLPIWTHRDFYEWKSGEARSRKPSLPGRPGLYEETRKSVFHLNSQICGSFIEALSKTGLTNQSKQYQLLRFC